MLKCKGCGEVMSPNNPLQTCKQHSSSCKPPGEEEAMIQMDDGEAGPSRSAKRQGQSSLTSYIPLAEKQDAVNKEMLCFIIISELYFRKLKTNT
eukprot:1157801-Pelagomonas_calceolata.AAC.8